MCPVVVVEVGPHGRPTMSAKSAVVTSLVNLPTRVEVLGAASHTGSVTDGTVQLFARS